MNIYDKLDNLQYELDLNEKQQKQYKDKIALLESKLLDITLKSFDLYNEIQEIGTDIEYMKDIK